MLTVELNVLLFSCQKHLCKDKAITLQALAGPEGYGRLRLPDFKTICT
jgi:hypothetical protein